MFYRSKVRWFEEVRWVLSIMSLVVDRFGGESLTMLFKGRTMAKPIPLRDRVLMLRRSRIIVQCPIRAISRRTNILNNSSKNISKTHMFRVSILHPKKQISNLQVLLRPTRPSPFIDYIRARQQRLKRYDHEQENTHARRLPMYDYRDVSIPSRNS